MKKDKHFDVVQAYLDHARVKVFQQNSQRESLVIKLGERPDHNGQDSKTVAHRLLNTEVHAQWPHLKLAMVDAVADGETRWV